MFWVSGEVCSLFMYILWYRLHSATRVLSTSASFCLPYLVCTMFLSHLIYFICTYFVCLHFFNVFISTFVDMYYISYGRKVHY